MKTKKYAQIGGALIAIMLFNTVAFAFDDLPDAHKAKVAVDYLVDQGCLKGYDDNTFRPDNNVSRVESLKIVLACLDLKELTQFGEFILNKDDTLNVGGVTTVISTDNTAVSYVKHIRFPAPADDEKMQFKDIDLEDWYIPYLKESIHRNLVRGYVDGTIKPQQQVSLAELLTILMRAAKAKNPDMVVNLSLLPSYIAESEWYAEGIAFGLEQKLIGVEEGKRLAPFYNLNRGEAVIIVYNYIVLGKKIAGEPVPTTTTTTETQIVAATNVNSSLLDFTESGVASYYGYGVDGSNTASGEKLDVNAYQVAHKTLPFNSVVTITNPANGKWVKARVIDRGPHIDGRIVDLTPSAFEAIADLSAGVVKVDLTVDSVPNS